MRFPATIFLAALAAPTAPPFEFSLDSPGGTPVRSADLAGRPVALVLWASWSPPSRTLARHLVEISSKEPFARIAFVGANFETGTSDAQVEATRRFAAETGVRFPLALGDDSLVRRVKGFKGYPAVLLLDAQHRPVDLLSGYDERPRSREGLERRLLALVPGPPAR